MKPLKLLLLSAAFFILLTRTEATTFYVDVNNTAPVSPFATWATAATNIQDAIDASTDGDTVLVTNGLYATGGEVVYGGLINRVVVNKAVTVQSVNGPAMTLIQGIPKNFSQGVRCVYLTNNAVLSGFCLTNGGAGFGGPTLETASGGGVWCESSSALISNCVIVASFTSHYGGGAFSGTLVNCILTNNTAQVGGGGASFSLLTNCVLSGNSSTNGGGATFSTLVGCTLTNNFAFNGGGACSNTLTGCWLVKNKAVTTGGGALGGTLNNCMISNNVAQYGGGTASNTLTSCTLCANTATYGGGAFYATLTSCLLNSNTATHVGGGSCGGILNACVINGNQANEYEGVAGGACFGNLINCLITSNNNYFASGAGACNLTNCTITGNGNQFGGGVVISLPGGFTCANCIVYNNSEGEIVGDQTSGGGGTIINCCLDPGFDPAYIGGPALGWITNDPAFVNPSAGDYHLQSNSPCINSGNNPSVASATDLDGNPRIVGGTVYIGAYEFQSPSSVLSYAWAQQYGLPTDGSADYADSDGDGMNNWQEWIAGTIPTNPASVLALQTPGVTATNATITWQSVAGINYLIQRGSDLGAQPPFSTIQSNIVGLAGTTSYIDTNAVGSGPFFYRVGVQQ